MSIRNQKMLLWDIPPPPLILFAQKCFLRDSYYLFHRGPYYQLRKHPVFSPLPFRWGMLGLQSAGGTESGPWEYLQGPVRSGKADGQGATWNLWVCKWAWKHESPVYWHGFCKKDLFPDIPLPCQIQYTVKSLPSLPVHREVNIYLQCIWWTFR